MADMTASNTCSITIYMILLFICSAIPPSSKDDDDDENGLSDMSKN